MATYVLVHGRFSGGWIWRYVTPELRNRGHDVYPVTLTGLGERAHLATPDVGLETQIQDVLGVFEYEDLQDVILVGHSGGGMAITGVANRVPERVAQLVYLDAFVPRDGESIAAIVPRIGATLREQAEAGDGWRVPPPTDELRRTVGDATAEERFRWTQAKLTPQPLKTFLEPLRLIESPVFAAIPRTFIACTKRPAPSPMWQERVDEARTGED